MYPTLPFTLIPLLILSVAPEPTNASLFSRSASYALERAHHVALKHSAGLARDLRVAFKAVLVPNTSPTTPRSLQARDKVYCVTGASTDNSGSGSGSSGGNGSSSTAHATSTSKGSSTKTATGSAASSTSTASSPWSLAESHSGTDFFTGWSFFTGGDPTHGAVTFVDQATAESGGLASINSAGNALMSVDTTATVASTRNSVRITTNSQYTGGLWIMDSVHMPTGCAVWPAFWTNGPTWPATGEIDIVEGVNTYTNNQATIHTNPGCSIPSASSSVLNITGTVVGGTDCSAADTGNEGCGVRSTNTASFGAAFNNAGGGVYAMKWDDSGISIYFFPRNSIPADITAETPLPDNWGQPMASWPATDCSPATYFSDHSAIFDTTLCGDWAGGVWTGTGIPGQDTSCAASTGFSTCEAYVAAVGAGFDQAYWEVVSVKIYQDSS